MYSIDTLAVGSVTAIALGVTSYALAASRDKSSLQRKKVEELQGSIEELTIYVTHHYGNVRNAENAVYRMKDTRTRGVINRMICELKTQVSMYLPKLSTGLGSVISAISTAHDALARVARVVDNEPNAELDVLDLALANMKFVLDRFKDELRQSGDRVDFVSYILNRIGGARHALAWRLHRIA